MKKKGLKRGISMAMAAAMAMGVMVMPVSAAENTTLNAEYDQKTSYVLSIPATISLSNENAVTLEQEIGVTDVNTTSYEKVQVKISSGINASNNKLQLWRQYQNGTIDYSGCVVSDVTGKNDEVVTNGFVVAEFENMSKMPLSESNGGVLKFSKISDSAGATIKAGKYVGYLTFEGKVVNR